MTENDAPKWIDSGLRETNSLVHQEGQSHSRFPISLERPQPYRVVVHEERKWRLPDILEGMDGKNLGLVVSRWRGTDLNEHSFEITGDYHILAIALQPSKLSLRLGTKLFAHQELVPGVIQITPPGVLARAVYSRPYDILHFHIPSSLLMECFRWSHGKWPADGIVLRDPLPARDALLQKLGTTLLSIADIDGTDCRLFSDFLSLAIVTRLLGLYGETAHPISRKVAALPGWRLKRVIEFIETHLSSSVTLADFASVAGLSPMHFAAQFRAAMGARPHEYLLQRRIAKAQVVLATTNLPIAEVALMVGFSSQAHFAVVFKRFSGLTPFRWRLNHRHGRSPR